MYILISSITDRKPSNLSITRGAVSLVVELKQDCRKHVYTLLLPVFDYDGGK